MHKHAEYVPLLKIMNDACRACELVKAHKLSFSGNFRTTKAVGEVIHSDIMETF